MSSRNPFEDEAAALRYHEANQQLFQVMQEVSDERSFLTFLRALQTNYDQFGAFWTNQTPKEFLAGAEWWGGGDFVEGAHAGEPILRRVAQMLAAARDGRA